MGSVLEEIENIEAWCSTPTNRYSKSWDGTIERAKTFNEFTDALKHIEEAKVSESKSLPSDQHDNKYVQSPSFCISIDHKPCNDMLSKVEGNQNVAQIHLNQAESISISESICDRTYDFSKRHDVRNKSAIRLFRKYYLNLFKKMNQKFVRMRFWNVKWKDFVIAIEKLLLDVFQIQDRDIVYYLLGVLKFKDMRRINWGTEIKREIKEFQDWVTNYTKAKFLNVLKSNCFQTLVANALNKNAFVDYQDWFNQVPKIQK